MTALDRQQTRTTGIRRVEHSQCSTTSARQAMVTRRIRRRALGGAQRCSGDEAVQSRLDARMATVVSVLSRAQARSS